MIGTFFSLLLFIYRTLYLFFCFCFSFRLFICFSFSNWNTIFSGIFISRYRGGGGWVGICGRKFMWMHFQFPQVITRREVLMIGMNWAWGISNYCLVMLMKEIRFKFLSRIEKAWDVAVHTLEFVINFFLFSAAVNLSSGHKNNREEENGKKQW